MLQSTRFQLASTLRTFVVLAVVTTGCAAASGGSDSPSTSAVTRTESTAAASTRTSSQVAVSDAGETDDEQLPAQTVPSEAPIANATSDDQQPDGTTETTTPYEAIDALKAALEDSAGSEDVPPLPPDSLDAYLGTSPDAYAASVISLGLEEAGVDLTGITLSVLPVTGVDASLLVLEIGDEYVGSGLLSETAGADITGALLTLPELDTASISELVIVYRGVDEQGPFTMTFAVSINALRDAYAAGGEALGDALHVQVDRGS